MGPPPAVPSGVTALNSVLGFALYAVRNRGRALALLGMIVLAVMEVSTVALLTGSLAGDVRLTMVDPLRYFTEVVAAGAAVPEAIASRIAARPQTSILLPMLPADVRVNTLTGPSTRNVFCVPVPFMSWFLAHIGERLVGGRLPAAGAAEVALPVQVMRNRHLRLGDVLGQSVDANDWLPGAWTVVGELAGGLQAGVGSYEAMRGFTALADVPGVASYAAFARRGALPALDRYLRTLSPARVHVYTLAIETAAYRADVRELDWLVWSINLVTSGVLSLAMGLLNNLYYAQRMDEFGILAAIGFTPGALARRALVEVAVVAAASWLCGLAMTAALTSVLAARVFSPQGIQLPGLDLRDAVFTLPIPVLLAGFSLGTVLRRLGRLDPVAVVERR